jgi:hypothetical protein
MPRCAMSLVPVFPLLTCLAVVGACGAESPHYKTDAEQVEMKGPVREVSTEFRGNEKDQWGQYDSRRLGIARYDRQG